MSQDQPRFGSGSGILFKTVIRSIHVDFVNNSNWATEVGFSLNYFVNI
jgi:hypothetical protein